jgi:hypothetical protein
MQGKKKTIPATAEFAAFKNFLLNKF